MAEKKEVQIDKLCLEILDGLKEISSQIVSTDINENSLSKSCIDFETNWNMGINIGNLCNISGKNMKTKFEIFEPRIRKKTKKCIVFGRTSAGKSSFINALLGKPVLPTSFGSTSNCFVEIQASPDNRYYLKVNNEEKQIEDLKQLTNLKDPRHLENGSLINLFYNKEICLLLSKDVVMIDTPGLDTNLVIDDAIKLHFSDADLIILIVNAMNGLSGTETELFSRFKDIFSILNVMIVFNFWDTVCDEDDSESVKIQQTNQAKTLLCSTLKYSEEKANKNIYFISAKQQINFSKNNSNNLAWYWKSNNGTFNRLYNDLQREMNETSLTRRCNYLMELFTPVSNNVRTCQDFKHALHNKSLEFFAKLNAELKSMSDINGKINQQIKDIYTESFDEFLIEGIKIIKNEKSSEDAEMQELKSMSDINGKLNQQIKDIYTESFDEFLIEGIKITKNEKSSEDAEMQELKELLEDNMENNLRKLEKKIIEFIHHEDQERFLLRQNIMNELYFRFIQDLKNQNDNFKMTNVSENLNKINKHIEKGTLATVTATTVATIALGVGTCGIGIAVEIGVAGVVGIAAGGGIIAGALGIGTSLGATKAFKLPFRLFWKTEESNIKTIWNSFESALTNSYTKFSDDLMTQTKRLKWPIVNKTTEIQNSLNEIREDLNKLKGSLIV